MYVNNLQLTKIVIRDSGQTCPVSECAQRVTDSSIQYTD
jgi:hypothetical protein